MKEIKTERIGEHTLQYYDPLTGHPIIIRSIYIPKNLLLKGALYKRGPTVLGVQQTIKEKDHE